MSDARTTPNAADHDPCPILLLTAWGGTPACFPFGLGDESPDFAEFRYIFACWKREGIHRFWVAERFLLDGGRVFSALLAQRTGPETSDELTVPLILPDSENATQSSPKIPMRQQQFGACKRFRPNGLCLSWVFRMYLAAHTRCFSLRNQAGTDPLWLTSLRIRV